MLLATMGKRASAVQGWMAWLLLKDQGYAGLQIRQKLSSLGPIFACQTPQVRQAPRLATSPQFELLNQVLWQIRGKW